MKESILSKYSNTIVTLCHAHEIICRTTEFFPPKNSCPKYTTVGVKVPVLNWKKIISGNYAWSEDREGGFSRPRAFFQVRWRSTFTFDGSLWKCKPQEKHSFQMMKERIEQRAQFVFIINYPRIFVFLHRILQYELYLFENLNIRNETHYPDILGILRIVAWANPI